jgi:CrcB protein
LFVFLGGGAGAVLRYLITLLCEPYSLIFPLGTFVINITGSFLIGFLAIMLEHTLSFTGGRHLLVIGLLGGFTTFSAFSFESVDLLRAGNYSAASAYIFGSLVLCLLATLIGLWCGRLIAT